MATHPLDSCLAKIERAKENINELANDIRSLYEGPAPHYRIVGQHEDGATKYVYRAYGGPLPVRFGVIAGEIIHHLRSSLDHLLWALIANNGQTPGRNSQFPICVTREKFEAACNGGMIKGVSPTAKKIIRAVQPYTRGKPEESPLVLLHENDIRDKHQALVLVGGYAHLGHRVELKNVPGVKSTGQANAHFQLPKIVRGWPELLPIGEDGAIICSVPFDRPAPHLKLDVHFIGHVAFQKFGSAENQSIIPALVQLRDATLNIVDLFKGEF